MQFLQQYIHTQKTKKMAKKPMKITSKTNNKKEPVYIRLTMYPAAKKEKQYFQVELNGSSHDIAATIACCMNEGENLANIILAGVNVYLDHKLKGTKPKTKKKKK
ncbi:MAG: hypothetical protein ABIW84_10890 [Ilumatobacteraceae bacterium]